MRVYLFLILFTIFPFIVFSQKTTFKGTIHSPKKEILEAANVIITNLIDNDSSVVDFKMTDKNGAFEMEFKQNFGKYLFTVSYIGYKDNNYIFNYTSNTPLEFKHTFEMQNEDVVLEEVTVKGKKQAVIVEGDTTSYNVKSFKTGFERNLEDLLKKLPNINVGTNGDITFKGKPIEKVLIDGQELFAENYKAITKNLTAKAISGVQAIENYEDNPILQLVNKSNKTVLNIQLESSFKNVFFGDLNIGVNSLLQAELATNAFNLKNKLKFGSVVNLNNIGFDPLPDAQYYLNKDFKVSNGFIFSLENESQSIINVEPAYKANLLQSKYLNNNVGLVSGSVNYMNSNGFKINYSAYLISNKNNFIDNINTIFLQADSLSYKENYDNNYYQKFFSNSLQIDYLASRKTFLRFYSNLGFNNEFNNSNLNLENINERYDLKRDQNQNSFIVKNTFQISHKINEKWVLDFNSQLNFLKKPNLLDILTNNTATLNQNIAQDNVKNKNNATLFYKFKKIKWTQSLISENSTSNIDVNEANQKSLNFFKDQSLLYSNEVVYQFKKLVVSAGLSFVNYKINDLKLNQSLKESASPFFFIGYKSDQLLKISLIGTNSLLLPSYITFAPARWLDQRYRMQGLNVKPFSVPEQLYLLIISKNDIETFSNFNLNFTLSTTDKSIINSTFINSRSVNLNKAIIEGRIYKPKASINYNRRLDFLNTMFTISSKIGQNQSFFAFNSNVAQKLSLNYYNIDGHISTNMNFPLNFELDYGKESQKSINKTNPLAINIDHYGFYIRQKYSEKINSYLTFNYDFYTTNSSKSVNKFVDFDCKFLPKNTKYEWTFTVNNILNQKVASFKTINSFYKVENNTNIRPIHLNIRFKYSFTNK